MEVARDCFYAAETYEDGLVILPETRGSSFLKKSSDILRKGDLPSDQEYLL